MATGKRWTDIPLKSTLNDTDLIRVNENPEDKVMTANVFKTQLLGDGTWENPLVLGTIHLWADTLGKLRIKTTAPTFDTDGSLVGSQS
jgi:hypothetical protein